MRLDGWKTERPVMIRKNWIFLIAIVFYILGFVVGYLIAL